MHLVGRVAYQPHQHHEEHADRSQQGGITEDALGVVAPGVHLLQSLELDDARGEGLGHGLVELLKVLLERLLEAQVEVAVEGGTIEGGKGRRLIVEVADAEVVELTRHLEAASLHVDGTSQDLVAPVHPLGKGLVDDDFIVLLGHASLLEAKSHQFDIVLAHEVAEAGGKERLAVVSLNHRTAVAEGRGAVGAAHLLHVGQSLEELVGGLALLVTEGGVSQGHPLGTVTQVATHHIAVLGRHDAHHTTQEGHTSKLHEEQRPLPPLLALHVAAKHLRDGYRGKKTSGQHATHYEEEAYDQGRHPEPLGGKEQVERSRGDILHEIAEYIEQHGHHPQGGQDNKECLQKEHPHDASG